MFAIAFQPFYLYHTSYTGMAAVKEHYDMVRLPSHEVQRNWGEVQDRARIEPVIVTSKGRDRIVMLSPEEYLPLGSAVTGKSCCRGILAMRI